MNLTTTLALEIVGDPQAIERGYLTEKTVSDAQAIADEVLQSEWLGRLGFLSSVGQPHQWWADNCAAYAALAEAPEYQRNKPFRMLIELAEYLVANERIDRVEARVSALELMKANLSSDEATELAALKKWLSRA